MTIYNKSILSLWTTMACLSTAMAMEQQTEPTDHLSALPNELKVEILSYLPVSEVTNISSINKHWNTIANDDALWRNFCAEANLEMSAKAKDQTWEKFYKDELKPVKVRFSIQKPNKKPSNISHYEVSFMGENFSLSGPSQDGRIRKKDPIILTKDKVRKNYGCAYSVISAFVYPMNSPFYGPVYWQGLKDVQASIEEKSVVLDSLHKIEAFAIFLGKGCTEGDVRIRYKAEAPAKL